MVWVTVVGSVVVVDTRNPAPADMAIIMTTAIAVIGLVIPTRFAAFTLEQPSAVVLKPCL